MLNDLQYSELYKCKGFNGWTGPLACLSLSSVELVDKVRLQTGDTAFPVKFFPIEVRWQRVKVFGTKPLLPLFTRSIPIV